MIVIVDEYQVVDNSVVGSKCGRHHLLIRNSVLINLNRLPSGFLGAQYKFNCLKFSCEMERRYHHFLKCLDCLVLGAHRPLPFRTIASLSHPPSFLPTARWRHRLGQQSRFQIESQRDSQFRRCQRRLERRGGQTHHRTPVSNQVSWKLSCLMKNVPLWCVLLLCHLKLIASSFYQRASRSISRFPEWSLLSVNAIWNRREACFIASWLILSVTMVTASSFFSSFIVTWYLSMNIFLL